MKKFIIGVFCLLLTESLFAWAPGWINNSSKYQGDNSVINIASGTIRTLNVTTLNSVTSTLSTISGTAIDAVSLTVDTIDADKTDNTNAADGTAYYTFISSVGASPAASAEVGTGQFGYNLYIKDNQTFTAQALEGVVRVRGTDENRSEERRVG